MNILNEIILEVFPNEDVSNYAVRFEILYHVLFEKALEEEIVSLKKEIIECEQLYAENTRLESYQYSNPTEDMIINMYSGVAYTLASKRRRTGDASLCAKYLFDIFSTLLESDLLSYKAKQINKLLISESLVDFKYATGKTDSMSFRVHNIPTA